jgi:hypothetical protein
MGVTVVHSTLTGHVLGAIDRNATGAGLPAVADLVGDALPLRRPVGPEDDAPTVFEVLVPADQLATAAVQPPPDLFTTSMAYAVEAGTGGVAKPALLPLSPWATTSQPVVLKSNGVTVTLDRTTKGVPASVLVVLAGDTGTVVLSGQIFAERKTVTIGVSLAAGWYAVLTLATGWQGRLEAVKV